MDHAAVEASLASIRLDIIGNDRQCDGIARLYLAAGEVPQFDIGTQDFTTDPNLVCASHYWRRRLLDEPTVAVVAECASWLAAHLTPEHRETVCEQWSVEFADSTKYLVQPMDGVVPFVAELADGYLDRSGLQMICLYHACKLRLNYRFEELLTFLDAAPIAGIADFDDGSPVFTALRASGLLGSRTRHTGYALELVERVWTSSARTRASVDILTDGLDLAPPFDGHGELLRRYAAAAVAAYSGSHTFLYLLARGLYICGDYDDALHAIDEAVQRIPSSSDTSDYLRVMARYRDLRHAISTSRDASAAFAASEDRADKILSTVPERIEQVEHAAAVVDRHGTLSSSMTRIVLALALFGCAAAFMTASSNAQTGHDLGLADRQWQVVVLGGSLAIFLVTLLGAAHFVRGLGRRKHR
ncbi:hypothetical protein ACQPW1_02265 [Nocardia sp. CA-128927]|uniref:hypothetical protein n=1 Tax=Nocardia sp. CA-128927 TaxID=3239975 RepID=UPI003D989B8E